MTGLYKTADSESLNVLCCFFFQAEDGIRDYKVTGVQTCALPIFTAIRFHRGAIQSWACQKNPCQCFLGLWLAIPGRLAQQCEHGGVVTRSLGFQGQDRKSVV